MSTDRTSRVARLIAAALGATLLTGPALPPVAHGAPSGPAQTAGAAAPAQPAAPAPAIDTSFPAPTPNDQPDAFYTPPSPIPAGAPGDVIRARVAAAGPPTARELANAWQVMYLSTDALGQRDVVTGTVLVPKGADPKTVPVVGLGPGTTGPAFQCTVSRFINSGAFYEQPVLNGLLRAGYAVAVTDYEGYHQDPDTSYIVGRSMGPALIDAVRAATRLPQAGLAATPKVAFQGYSQGGGAAMWAGQLAPTYAPELDVVGVSGGGVPADLTLVALGLEGKRGFGFFLDAILGLDHAYPDLTLDAYLNDTGRRTLAAMNGGDCTLELLTSYSGRSAGDYTTQPPFLEPAWITRVAENKLGGVPIQVPVFQYHGTKDDIVPFGQAASLRTALCRLGVNETWRTYDVDHITGVARGNADALAFLADRFAGRAVTGNCSG